jgi:hypothetical protein
MAERKTVGRRAAVRWAGALGAAGAGAALLHANGGTGAVHAAGQGQAIVGTWLITSPGPSMRLLQTYSADGTHLSVHDEHPIRSPQLGTWVQVGEREFLMRNLSFRFDDQGNRTGSIDVRAVYTVSPAGDTMTGRGVRLELDLAGELLEPPIPWQSQAARVTPIPLD